MIVILAEGGLVNTRNLAEISIQSILVKTKSETVRQTLRSYLD